MGLSLDVLRHRRVRHHDSLPGHLLLEELVFYVLVGVCRGAIFGIFLDIDGDHMDSHVQYGDIAVRVVAGHVTYELDTGIDGVGR